jgi:hypothetical protein
VPQQGNNGGRPADAIDRMRIARGFWVIIAGFALIALVALAAMQSMSDATQVAAAIGSTAGAAVTAPARPGCHCFVSAAILPDCTAVTKAAWSRSVWSA